MKKFLPVLMFLIFSVMFAPLVKAQDYDGPVFKNRIPVNRENRGVYFRHDSVKWGGKKFAWGSNLSIRFRDHYSKSSPGFLLGIKQPALLATIRCATGVDQHNIQW